MSSASSPGPTCARWSSSSSAERGAGGTPAARGLDSRATCRSDSPRRLGRASSSSPCAALVDEHRLVTVVGPAGVGKTRLALEAGSRLSVAGWCLAGASRRRRPPRCPGAGRRGDPPRAGSAAALRERLSGASTVLLLDNCEHVVGPV